ncbi:hypothetical protein CGRA01v4_00959 [Colletotrichum graminicola]|uniref:Uncharacterized protein n=1 Tax=Colletotrichum graminicola (strain M1.001 / M2 / FGSC 10212) TaxID=645133 RepID=E3QGY7_COLGM|nr:uncharacterized protein GLRG_05269 [Colletotrichum graminicola M1.001]EFQ30125.1 hypothetical protein GLRG_05269 [Colletotrichum graminicola M1.001]WDK09682.1 hypothetical protein CGRA01v4_00959 [Colletotrichum graminicola]
MSSSGQKLEEQESPDSPRTNPLDAYIPIQSQLVRFQQEHPRDGNALVLLSNRTRGVRSSIEYHTARAAHAIESFQQRFAGKPLSGPLISAAGEPKPPPEPERH